MILENIDIDIDIDKAILQNIDIDKISNRLKFGISNRAIDTTLNTFSRKTELIVFFLPSHPQLQVTYAPVCKTVQEKKCNTV